jgi:uncharacterized paraquat-inducible protein A
LLRDEAGLNPAAPYLGMNEPRSKSDANESQRRKDSTLRPTLTHCVACNYESKRDFDVCPKCQTKGMAVLVIRKT